MSLEMELGELLLLLKNQLASYLPITSTVVPTWVPVFLLPWCWHFPPCSVRVLVMLPSPFAVAFQKDTWRANSQRHRGNESIFPSPYPDFIFLTVGQNQPR